MRTIIKLILILILFVLSLTTFSQTYKTETKVKEGKDYTVFTFTNNTNKSIYSVTVKSQYTDGKYIIPKSLKFDVNLSPGETLKGNIYDYHTYLINETTVGYKLVKYEVIFH